MGHPSHPIAVLSVGGRPIKNLSMWRGDTLTIEAHVFEGPPVLGDEEDLTDATLYFTAKQSVEQDDNDAVIRKSSGVLGGIEVAEYIDGEVVAADPADGVALIFIYPTDTESLPASLQNLIFDFQLERANDEIHTTADGTMLVYPDVTITT